MAASRVAWLAVASAAWKTEKSVVRKAAPWAAYSAADFADMENLNAMADSGDFDGYCDRINRGHKTRAEGDSNGYAERFVGQ